MKAMRARFSIVAGVLLSCYCLAATDYNFSFSAERIWDFTGAYHYKDAISDRTHRLIHTPSGSVSGRYDETYTNDVQGFVAFGTIKGRVVTARSGVLMKNKMIMVANGSYLSDGASLHFEAAVSGDYQFGDDALIAALSGRVCFTRRGDTDCRTGTVPDSIMLPSNMDGAWTIAIEVSGERRLFGEATVTLSTGRVVAFSCVGTRNAKGSATMRLSGVGEPPEPEYLSTCIPMAPLKG